MSTLQGFIDEVVAIMANTLSLSSRANPAVIRKWPAAPVWATMGRAGASLGSVVDYDHEVRLGLLGPRNDMERIAPVLLGKLETLIEELLSRMLKGQYTNIESFTEISYVFGPIDWAGQPMFGFLMTIHDVNIRNTL